RDSSRLAAIRASRLDQELEQAAIERAVRLVPDELRKAGLARAHGRVCVKLMDDEWLPTIEETECGEMVDSDVTELMHAANRGDEASVTKLLNAGAKVNDRDQRGNTALLFAASRNNLSVVRALLAAGADVDVTDKDGETPL